MMSSMFEIPILYVACDVKIVKKRVSFFCSRVLRKIQLQKKFVCFGGLFFSKKTLSWDCWTVLEEQKRGGEQERANRTESKLFLVFKNLINY